MVISFVFAWDSREAISAGGLRNTFLMAAIASLILGLYSFTLPATAPLKEQASAGGVKQLLGLDALGLLKDRSYLVFFIASILICIPLAFYYQNANPFLAETGMTNPTAKMAIGQVSEVLFMLLLPLFIQRFGIKLALLVGMLAWALRYVLFAYGNNGDLAFMLFTGIALHGICYDFFFCLGADLHRRQGTGALSQFGPGPDYPGDLWCGNADRLLGGGAGDRSLCRGRWS